MLALLVCMPGPAVGALSNLDLKFDPPLDQIRPNRDEAHLVLRRVNDDRSGRKVRWNVALDLPPPGRVLSTDFPAIEGKRLIEAEFITADEEVAWSIVFPIRGRYELTVKSQAEGSRPVESRFSLFVREDPQRIVYLALFVLALLALGFFIGRMMPAAGTTVALFTLLLAGVAAEARLNIEPAKVGNLTPIRFVHRDFGDATVEFSIVREEDRKRLFHIEGVTIERKAVWGYHFFDGSPHRVTANVRSPHSALPSRTEKKVHVDAHDPPPAAVWSAYALFLIPIVTGCLAGRWVNTKS